MHHRQQHTFKKELFNHECVVNHHALLHMSKLIWEVKKLRNTSHITTIADFGDIYDQMPAEIQGDAEMAEERRYFMSKVDNLSMRLTFCQEEVISHSNMYIVE